MRGEIVVSILVMCYNQREYIKKAIASIREQEISFQYEVIIGDDCSTDGTSLILKAIERDLDEHYEIIYREKNVGMNKNYLDLVAKAQGKYVIVLEGDDYWNYKYKIEEQVKWLENNPNYVAVAHKVNVVDINGKVLTDMRYPDCDTGQYNEKDYKRGILPGQTSTLMYKNIFREKSELPKVIEGYPMDQWIIYVLMSRGKIFCIDEKWSTYRYALTNGSFSATNKNDVEFKKKTINFYESIYRFSADKGEPLVGISTGLYFWELFKNILRKEKIIERKTFFLKYIECENKKRVWSTIAINICSYPLMRIEYFKKRKKENYYAKKN